MEIQYRKMTPADVDTFISMRIKQLREEGATEDIDLIPALSSDVCSSDLEHIHRSFLPPYGNS